MNSRAKASLLLFFFSLCGSAALLMYYRQASEQAAQPAELYALVYEQVKAMRTDEYREAYQRVSATIQKQFSLEQFAQAVRTDYADAARADSIEFGDVDISGRHAAVQVFFVERSGHVLPCVYFLVFEEGCWKINGTHMMRRWPAGSRLGGLRA